MSGHPISGLDGQLMCHRFPPNSDSAHLYRFKISGYDCSFGYMVEKIVKTMEWRKDWWEVDHDQKFVKLLGKSLHERNSQLHETLLAEKDRGKIKNLSGWANEVFSVYGPDHDVVVSIERAAAPLFGIITYGVQLLAWQRKENGLGVWIARRSKTKRNFPNMLDSTVGGSLPTGETPFECLVRESGEEASFQDTLIRQSARACGTINYVDITDERGGGEVGLLWPEVQFTYEIELPDGVIPVPGDNEAEEIKFLDIIELKKALSSGQFTPANGCVVLDFFVRHDILNFENEPDYIEVASRLHRAHEFPTA